VGEFGNTAASKSKATNKREKNYPLHPGEGLNNKLEKSR
jgi:hypothetical protein